VNVRLDADRLRKAQMLRARGVTLSDVVREAIDEQYAALRRSGSPPDVRTIVRRIFEQYPDPPDLPPRDYDIYDRRAARVAILRKLRTVRR
jgi:DNA-binding NarL/FixJ family response regulator